MKDIKKIPLQNLKNGAGFTYIETILGLIIILFILVGMNSVFGIAFRNDRKAGNMYIALGLADELIEQIKSKDFTNITSISSSNINNFTRRADVFPNYQGNQYKKLVIVTVSGPDIRDIRLDCIMSDPSLP